MFVTTRAEGNSVAETEKPNPFAEFSDSDPHRAKRGFQTIRAKLIFYFSHRRLQDPENLADDVIARAWRRYTDGASIEELLQYCYGIAANVVKEMQKKRADDQLTPDNEAPDERAVQALLASENNILLEECLQALSAPEGEVLVGYFNTDRTALAARLGITANALRIRVSRSLDKIQRTMGMNEKAPKSSAEMK